VTGILWTLDGLTAKYLELARELLPSALKIGLLVDILNPSNVIQQREAEAAVRTLDAQIITLEVRKSEDIEAAFQTMTREGVRVVVVLGSAMFINARVQIATLAAVARIASIYPNRQHVEAGGLISYGVDLLANHQRAADFVDRILKGAKPIELPVEFPPRISLAINLTTAKALGITIPPALLARADEVIE
jgi:putative tryptophan/tyrosine transport system substrate-binding protein